MKINRSFIPFIFFVFIMKFAAVAQTNEKESINIDQLINTISDSLKANYIFPGKAMELSNYLHTQKRSGTYANFINNPQMLAGKIEKDISSIQKDPHLRIVYDPEFKPQVAYQPTEEEKLFVKKYWKEHNYSFQKVELLPGNIGYLSFNLFVDDIEAAKPTIKAALTFLKNADALIIDLRNNMGGDPNMVSQIESFFFGEKAEMNGLINRSNNDTVRLYADPAKTDNLYLPMPVYILTSKNTFSGAEDFSYAMQVVKRATIVGETTGGGAHPQRPFAVGQGFVAYIPFARSLNPITKTDWEGTGVVPDEKIAAEQALLKALESIFKSKMEKSIDQNEKNKSQYFLNALNAGDTKKYLPVKKLSAFVGTFGGLAFYLDKGKLYCRNNNSGGSISELKYLAKNLFVLDKEAQVEFIQDMQQRASAIKIWVSDGNVFEEKKN